MIQLYLPPDFVADGVAPVVFLAGPILGADDWQSAAIAYFTEHAPQLIIASPRGNGFKEAMYNSQVDWETHHLNRAAQTGAILFWLANEVEHLCERAFAQTTRFELAEWKVKHERDGARLVVGIDRAFTGGRYIRRRFTQDCPDVPLCDTLETTCQAVIRLLSAESQKATS